jgi:hypothetical protein
VAVEVVVAPAEGSVDGSVDVPVLELESELLVDPLLAGGSLDVVEELVPEPLDVLSDAEVDDGVGLEVSLGVDEDELEVSVGVDEPVDEEELEVSLGVDEPVDGAVDEPLDDGLEDWLGVWVVDEPPDVVVVPVDEPPAAGVVVPVDEPPDEGPVVAVSSVGAPVGCGDPPVASAAEAEVLTVVGADAGDTWPAASFAATVMV